MRQLTSYYGKKVAVLGLGRSGLSAARALVSGGARVFAWDDSCARRSEAEESGLAVSNPYLQGLENFTSLILSPGIPLHYPEPHPLVQMARSAGCEIIGDIELFIRERFPGRLVVITGTNGKSTTTSLAGHVLAESGISVAVGGNVGIPVLELPDVSSEGVYVIEMSSYQLDLTPSLSADVAVLLNISPDHLNRHGGMAGYIAAKRQLLDKQSEEQIAVVGLDDEDTLETFRQLRKAKHKNTIGISGDFNTLADIYVKEGFLYDKTEAQESDFAKIDLNAVPELKGCHNGQNAAAAYAIGRIFDCSVPSILVALKSFKGLAHRMEDLGTVSGIRFVNDSKATNINSTGKALACYKNILWIAGGLSKEDSLEGLQSYFRSVCCAFLIGEAAEKFAAELEGQIPVTISGDLGSAFSDAHAYALSKNLEEPTILLSPACSSFDQFMNFEARGNQFKELVEALRMPEMEMGSGLPAGELM